MKLRKLYSLQNYVSTDVVKEKLYYPSQPEFADFISGITIVFHKFADSDTTISINLGDEVLEGTTFLRKGRCIYKVNNFQKVAYPNALYSVLIISFTGTEIPKHYIVSYQTHKYALFIQYAIRVFSAYTYILHSKYRYITYVDRPYLSIARTSLRLLRPNKVTGNVAAITCDDFDKILNTDLIAFASKLINPPVLETYYYNIMKSICKIKDTEGKYSILLKTSDVDFLLAQLINRFPTMAFTKIVKDSYDDYGITYDRVRKLVRYLYQAKYKKRKVDKNQSLEAMFNNSINSRINSGNSGVIGTSSAVVNENNNTANKNNAANGSSSNKNPFVNHDDFM